MVFGGLGDGAMSMRKFNKAWDQDGHPVEASALKSCPLRHSSGFCMGLDMGMPTPSCTTCLAGLDLVNVVELPFRGDRVTC